MAGAMWLCCLRRDRKMKKKNMCIRHTDLVFCRKISGTQSIETAGEWESEVVDACVAVCGEQEAALKIVSALVTTLKHPEASAVRHGASQVPGTTSRFLSVCVMLPMLSYVQEVSCCSRHTFSFCVLESLAA